MLPFHVHVVGLDREVSSIAVSADSAPLQILKARRLRMCTIDSAPRLAQTFSIASSTVQKELVDEHLLPQPLPGDTTADTLPALPQLARALLNYSVLGNAPPPRAFIPPPLPLFLCLPPVHA